MNFFFFVLTNVQAFPDAPKLWMMKGQLEQSLGKVEAARATYTEGTLSFYPVAVRLRP